MLYRSRNEAATCRREGKIGFGDDRGIMMMGLSDDLWVMASLTEKLDLVRGL